jgi:hypothetical protein
MSRENSKYVVPVLVAGLMLAIGGALGAVKLQRDYERKDAIEQLQIMGFGSTISARETVGTTLSFTAPARQLSDAEFDCAVASLRSLALDRSVDVVDFTKSRIDDKKLLSLQALLPESDLRQ